MYSSHCIWSSREAGLHEEGITSHNTFVHGLLAFMTVLAHLQVVSCCPIWLDYLKKPVTINCEYHFCHSCIIISWKEVYNIFPCVVFHFSVQTKTSGANLSSGIWLKSPRYFPEQRDQEDIYTMFENYNQLLTYFCEKHLEVSCIFSIKYQKHHIYCVKKAAPTKWKF